MSRQRKTVRRTGPATCNNCGARLIFVKMTATGARLPCDPIPVVDGNVCAQQIGASWHGFVISKDHPYPGPPFRRFAAHYATCDDKPDPKPKPSPPAALFDL